MVDRVEWVNNSNSLDPRSALASVGRGSSRAVRPKRHHVVSLALARRDRGNVLDPCVQRTPLYVLPIVPLIGARYACGYGHASRWITARRSIIGRRHSDLVNCVLQMLCGKAPISQF